MKYKVLLGLIFFFHIPVIVYLVDETLPNSFMLFLIWLNIPATIYHYLTAGVAFQMGNLGVENLNLIELFMIEGFYICIIYLMMRYIFKD